MGIVVRDRVERQGRIASEAKVAATQHPVLYRGSQLLVPVIRIPIDVPVYRLQNGRTRVKQIEVIRERQLSFEYFTTGEENVDAQIAQHRILLEMSKDPKGNIYQELERVARQTEPLLITATGVTVNGNRRLAAMRELHASDPSTFAEFGHVNAAVLPAEATVEDIETIEAELQLVPETKLDYGWIERRLSLRHKIDDLKMTRSRIKEMFRFQREEDINIELGQLSLAEQYLEEFLQKPLAYELVEQSFQLFQDLQAALAGKSGEEAEARRCVGFVLIKESRNLRDRAYSFRSAFGRDFNRFVEEFARCNGIEPPMSGSSHATVANNGDSAAIDSDDPLFGFTEAQPSYQPVINILADQSKTAETAGTIADVMSSIKSSQREEDAKRAPLKAVQDALRRLSDVDLTKADPTTFSAMMGQLDSIVTVAKDLRAKLEVQKKAR